MPSLLPLYRIASMSNGWFENLSECIRTDVLAHARERVLATGERLFSRGDEADGLYCVLEGSIRISVILEMAGQRCRTSMDRVAGLARFPHSMACPNPLCPRADILIPIAGGSR